MKVKSFILSAAIALSLTGCPSSTVTPPLAPGYQNAADQSMGEILAGARRFYVSIQTQTGNGSLTLGPSIKAAFNDFGVSLNAADSVYLAYHAGTATEAQAQAQVNIVQSKQAALPLPGAKQ
jgi:hypothetical protein